MRTLDARAWTAQELGDALDIDRKTAEYHLRMLQREGVVIGRVIYGERRFAAAQAGEQAFRDVQPQRTRYRIAQRVERLGLVRLDELARHLGISRNLASYHVHRLEDEGSVSLRRVQEQVVVEARDAEDGKRPPGPPE